MPRVAATISDGRESRNCGKPAKKETATPALFPPVAAVSLSSTIPESVPTLVNSPLTLS
jgi:hypothetical protein